MNAMMLRRRTERKAKAAASSLFKRVASGQDWSPSSPSTCIPVKRTSPKSKAVVTTSAKSAKSVTSSRKVSADSPKKEASRTQQKSGNLLKKADAKVQEKSDTMPKKAAAKLLPKTGKSHKKGVEVAPKQVRSVKEIDTKTQVKPSASPKKEDAKVLQRLSMSPKKESVVVLAKAVVSPKKEDSLVPQKTCTTPKKEDGKLSQKLVASSKKLEVESLQKTDVKKSPDVEKMDNTRCGDKPDKCVKKKVTSRSEKERSKEPKKDPSVVVSASPIKHEMSPVKEATESKTESGFECHAQKRKLEPEVESLMAEANDVCVKLMKLDEKAIKVDDETIDRIKDQATDGETRKEDPSPPLNAQIAHDQIDRNAIAYPSDCCPSVNFLAMIGLVPKSDIKKLEGSPNKLHREAGGKLRRILKPRLMPGMVYRKVAITKGLSLSGIVIDHQLKPATKSLTSIPSALQNAAQSKPKVSTFSTVTKFTILRKDGPPLLASPKLSKTRSAPPKLVVETVPLESKPEDPSTGGVVVAEEKMAEEVVAPPDDKSTEETKEAELDNVAVVQNPAKQKCVPKKKPEPMKPCTVLNETSDLEPGARRSARQQGNKRRVWGHLLRANPDEFEENHKWEMGLKDSPRNLPKTNSFEDGAKKPTDKTTNDELTVVDVVGGASSVQEKTGDEGCAGKPVQDSTACETESTQEPDSSQTESSFASPVVEAPAEMPCPAPEKKSSPGKKPAQLTGKRQKKVPKDKLGKSPRSSKTLSLAEKSKATEKTEEENRVSKSRSEPKVKSLEDVLDFSNYSFLSYRCKDTDCQTPHMCSVCWVNDHMYCRNMKRTTNDLPPFGGCIHYIPCAHYWPPSESSAKRSSGDHNSFHNRMNFVSSTFGVGDRSEGSSTVERSWNDDDLMCREQMIDSDSESHSPIPPQGTEILGIQLKSRAEQIIRSLGIDRMPESLDLRAGVQIESLRDLGKEEEEEEDCNVVVEEYGAELCIDNTEEVDDFQELKIEVQKDILGDLILTSKIPSVEEHDSGLAVNGRRENVSEVCVGNYDTPLDSTVCGMTKEFASGLLSSNMCVIRVQVQKLDSDRIRVTYPNILEGHAPGDDCGGCFVQKEVKFPTGADEKSLNEFLAQEAVRLVNEAPHEGQRKAAMGIKRAVKSGSAEHKQDRGTKRSVATATCPANQTVPSVMGKSKKKGKGAEQVSGCLDQTSLARKESLGQRPRKRSRKLLCQSDLVLPLALTATQSGVADLEHCGRDVSARGTALPTEMECLPTITGIESSAIVTSVQEFPLSRKVSQVALEEVDPSIHAPSLMDVTWSSGSTRIPAGDLAMLDSSSTSHSADPIIPTVVTNSIAPSLVYPVGCSALGEIPDGLTSRPYTLGSGDQEGQNVSAYQDQVINVNLDHGSSFAANNDRHIQSNRIVDFDRKTSVSPLVSDGGASLDGPPVVFHPYSSIDPRPLPVYQKKDLEQSCIAQILQQQNNASTSQPIVNTLSLSRGTSISTASVMAKTSLVPLSGPRAILPCIPPSCRPQICDSVGSISTAHSSFTGVVPGAITRATGLVIPLGYSMPGPFVSVTGRLPPQLTHLPISAAVCNSRQTKPNCVELSNVALGNMAFSNAALTGITLASTLPVKVAMGSTTSANLALTNVASTNLTSASLASMSVVLKNVACPNLAATNVAFGNSSSLRKALASMASVNMTPTSMASVSVVPVSVAPVSMASVSMASSVNMAVANMTPGNVACGSTIICMHPAGVGPPAMKIARLDHILAGNHGPPLLIGRTRSGMPNTIVSTRPAYTDSHMAQSCDAIQSPSLNMTKHCITSPLTLTGAPTGDILQMAWNQRDDDCGGGPVGCKVGSSANAICAVTSASNVSPTFFSVVDGSNVVV